jgi:hypothetical protein
MMWKANETKRRAEWLFRARFDLRRNLKFYQIFNSLFA